MLTIDPENIPIAELHQFILGTVAPRPIAFVSTMNEKGQPNLAPFSFFNAFSANPPTLIFSANRRVNDNSTKDTLHNAESTKEVVVNVVNYSILRQMTIASINYDADINEFDKSGLTPIPSDIVKPYRIKESPVQFECKVVDIIRLGNEAGAGNLVVCLIVKLHLDKNIFDNDKKIDPQKIDLVGRLGRAFYVRVKGDNVFPVVQPVKAIGIGFDSLPEQVRKSKILTGNELASLASLTKNPKEEEVIEVLNDSFIKKIVSGKHFKEAEKDEQIHIYAKDLISQKQFLKAYKVLLLREFGLI
jgi:flavin reductase (DIM6/NTAB) family NADH-FMN oxidoreductase RutF